MEFRQINNIESISKFLSTDPGNNIYMIGDLDPFFFRKTKWFAMIDSGDISELAMLYEGDVATTLLAFPRGVPSHMSQLLEFFSAEFPIEFYAHFGCGLMKELRSFRTEMEFGVHVKMILRHHHLLSGDLCEKIHRLGIEDIPGLTKLYENHYPGNYFDRQMLETGKYFGYSEGGELEGVAGIHVYSPLKKVAALGNIVVAGEHRGKGICRKLVSALCNDLLETVDIIGLNVFSENKAAIKCYENCGFVEIGRYEEYLVKKFL